MPEAAPASVPGGYDRPSLARASAAYATEIAVESELHVHRALEVELFEAISRGAHDWQWAIVGEAGAGKSTLLWALFERLRAQPEWDPVLLSASRLMDVLQTDGPQRLVDLLTRTYDDAIRPILLVDTVDLLLHGDAQRQPLLRLMDTLEAVGVPGVFCVRPQEASLLTRDELRWAQLGFYDDAELDLAVEALVVRFCPESDRRVIADRVRAARARGLPVSDVCRSPLLLRMLFDISSPAEPELEDVDVTRLYSQYWERRVVRDARSEVEGGFRASVETDKGSVAGVFGLALLAAGTPEIDEATLRDLAIAVGSDDATTDESVGVLVERGVLDAADDRISFFHQTMFEFAAARGLLASGQPSAMDALARRTVSNGGDLFVGSVLEQTLILAAPNPLFWDSAVAAVSELVEADSDSLWPIALTAWAHHPRLLDTTTGILRGSSGAALERAARVLPTIAGKPTGETISQLMILWATRDDSAVRSVVLASLARIALHAPEIVSDAVDHLDLVADMTATPLTDDKWRTIQVVLERIATVSPKLVRAVYVTALVHVHPGQREDFDHLIALWPRLGDEHLLAEIVRSLEGNMAHPNAAAPQLGRLLAAEWIRVGEVTPPVRTSSLIESVEGLSLMDAAGICALGPFLAVAKDPQIIAAALTDLLHSPEHLSDWVARFVLPTLWDIESSARAQLVTMAAASLATLGVDARAKRLSAEQTLLLTSLTITQLTSSVRRLVIPADLEPQEWLAEPLLARLAPMVADDGDPSALAFLDHLRDSDAVASPEQLDWLFSSFSAIGPRTEPVFERLMSIAIHADLSSRVTKLMASADRRGPRIAAVQGDLATYVQDLLGGSNDDQRRGASLLSVLMSQTELGLEWSELHELMGRIQEPDILTPLIGALWQQTRAGDERDVLAYLDQFIEVIPGRVPPACRRDESTGIGVAAAAAEARLRILGTKTTPNPDDWDEVLALTAYPLESAEVYVTGTRFVIACDYLARLGATHRREVPSLLLNLLTVVGTGEFFGITPTLWYRELRNAVHRATARNPSVTIPELLGACPPLDDDLGRCIAEVVADIDYGVARPALRELLGRNLTPGLRTTVLDLIREHDRAFGSQSFPEIIPLVRG